MDNMQKIAELSIMYSLESLAEYLDVKEDTIARWFLTWIPQKQKIKVVSWLARCNDEAVTLALDIYNDDGKKT